MRGLTRRLTGLAAAWAVASMLSTAPAMALDQIKMSIFQSNFCCFPVYVAKHLKLFEKHGVDVELVYGTGIQPANIMVSGSAESGAFAVEHGVTVSAKGQDVKLIVLEQQLPPLSLIARNDVPTPNADKPYPQNIVDLKGLKIGISGRGASTDTATRFMLKQAGLDPDKDVTIMPVGDPGTMLASLKNKVIDAVMAVEPAQTAAVQSLKIAKTMVDLEGGGGPAVFHPYAYNGVFVHSAFLKDHPDTARAIVAAIVEACQVVNDPARMNDLMDVAANYMKGSDPEVVKAYLTKYRSNYGPVATRKGIDNVSAMLVAGKSIEKAVPYEQIVATDFMPPEAGAPTR
ncbi:MAG TPA: ABC transporter substrate-binding protein [Xanthobacteraceae bacterium]|jgi:NitT/TauT family transport system substrate-binding protein|nr:ABC transporter substrate-binding protein [Xanthobacteraceae bacterium]